MFNRFPFDFGNVFNISGFIKFGDSSNFFTFGNSDDFFDKFKDEFVDDINLYKMYNKTSKNNSNNLDNINQNANDDSFIEFKEFDGMYVLKVSLNGIDLRDLSIQYNPGVIKIKAKKLEKQVFTNPNYQKVFKKEYTKKFENIEDIDLSNTLKSIDNGLFSIIMPKKYNVTSESNIVDVKDYISENKLDFNKAVDKIKK